MTNMRSLCNLILLFFLTMPMFMACSKAEVDSKYSTPRKTYVYWLEVSQSGDIAENLKCLNGASRKFMDLQVKNRDIFIDRMTRSAMIFKNYSIAGEKMRGGKAVLVLKEPKTGNTIPIPFMKEDGEWKVDLIALFSGGKS